jgi:hypothetical protein
MTFPSAPALYDTHAVDNRTYIWSGTAWKLYKAAAVGGGAVTSVAGKTGTVVLDVGDVSGADRAISTRPKHFNLSRAILPLSEEGAGIAFGNGLFVAVGAFNSAATSPDGINWTPRTIPGPNDNAGWQAVHYAGGMFIALSRSDNFGSGSPVNRFATSADGVTWTMRTMPAMSGTFNWRNLAYGNGTYVVTPRVFGGASNRYMTSADGATWTSRTLPVGAFDWPIAFGNGIFVAVGYQSNKIAYSSDGVSWTAQTFSGPNYIFDTVVFGGGKFVITGWGGINDSVGYGKKTYTSTDGISWASNSNALPPLDMFVENNRLLAYGSGSFLALSDGARVFASSSDGATWIGGATNHALDANSKIKQVAYGNGKFLAIGPTIFLTSGEPSVPVYGAPFGSAANTICEGDDLRLSDARSRLATASSFGHGNSGTSKTLSAAEALQTCSLTGNCTFTMPAATASDFVLVLTQTGSFTATFTNVRWVANSPPTISTGNGKVDIIQFVSDGANWYGTIFQNFS